MPDIRARAAAIFAGLTFRLVLLGLVALLAFNTYADIRVPLPLLPDIHFEGWKPKAERLAAELSSVQKVQRRAAAAQRAVNVAAERHYRDLAERIDNDAAATARGALADAERFIAAHRVRPVDRSTPCRSDPPAPDRSAGGGQAMPPAAELDGPVAVLADDVRTCTANTLQAEAARAWALELEAARAGR